MFDLSTLIGNVVIGSLGIFALIFASERVVGKLIRIAHHLGISTTFVGMSIVSIATSLPEISSHVIASIGILQGSMDYEIASSTVLGANIGSDVIQQTFIVGLVILIAGSVTFSKKFLLHDFIPMIATTLMCIILGFDGTYSRLDGMILFGTFIIYMYFLYKKDGQGKDGELTAEYHSNRPVIIDIITVLFGLAIMLGSAYIILNAAEFVVHTTGLGGSLVGVISLGVASALPELVTALTGIYKKDEGISLGTLIGSNITNPLVAIGGGALISTYWVPQALIYWDLSMETITAALLLAYLWFSKGKLGRFGAIYLILLYFAYLYVRMTYFSVDVAL